MAGQVWFGNAEKFVAIPAPRSGADGSHVGQTAVVSLLNGGAVVADSTAQHREWSFDWVGNPKDLRVIKDFIHGVYGPGPYYWTDPFAADTNLFSPSWAAPRLVDGDSKELFDIAHTGLALTPSNSYGHPGKSAVYDLLSAATAVIPNRRFTILIPTGKTLYVGVSGTATGSGVIAVRPILQSGAYTAVVNNTPLNATAATRFFATSYSSATYSGVEVFLSKTATGAAGLTLTSSVAILSPTGTIPVLTGPFVSGEGATGMRFTGGLKQTLYTSGSLNQPRQIGYAVKLVETESWEL